MAETQTLTSAQQAAMLLMSLDDSHAAELLKHMSEACVLKLREAAESLDVAQIGDAEKRRALVHFLVKQRKGGFFLGQPDEHFRRVLTRAVGEDGLRRIYQPEAAAEEEETVAHQSTLEYLLAAPEDHLATVLEKESPRCSAVLLTRLPGAKAGRVLNLIEEEAQKSIVERIIAFETAPAEVVDEIMEGVRQKLEDMKQGAEGASEERRAQDLARIVATLDKEAQERILSQLAERDPDLAQRVEQLMLTFSDLLKVGAKSMQELVRQVEVSHIALALKGASDEIREHFLSNISQRVRERVDEESELAGRVPVSRVEEAREEIMKVARRMYREGALEIELGGEQYVE